MFRRLFGSKPEDEQEESQPVVQVDAQPAEPENQTDRDLLAELLGDEPEADAAASSGDSPVVDPSSVAPVAQSPVTSAPATPPEPPIEAPAMTPLFSRTDEIERLYHRAPPAEAERRSAFRRLFGGEEHTVDEIAREERKTEQAVQKTRTGFFGRISEMFAADAQAPITDELWEELEELLIMADVGVDTTVGLIERVRRRAEREGLRYTSQARTLLKQEMVKLLQPPTRAYIRQSSRPYIIMVVGVNGSGKTTLIAKLANRYKNEIGQSIILGAADTFRAAAVEQLKTWADRIGVPVVAQGQGADPAAVAFDTVQAAHSRDVDVVIIDTAGRLQAKYNLMRELEKIVNVVKKKVEWAPHEVLLVIDATTGQNGLSQAKAFMEAAEITHLALTKLDGTAKGGIAFAMVQQVKRPIHYIGTGEKVDDLAIFDPEAFVDALFEEVPA